MHWNVLGKENSVRFSLTRSRSLRDGSLINKDPKANKQQLSFTNIHMIPFKISYSISEQTNKQTDRQTIIEFQSYRL